MIRLYCIQSINVNDNSYYMKRVIMWNRLLIVEIIIVKKIGILILFFHIPDYNKPTVWGSVPGYFMSSYANNLTKTYPFGGNGMDVNL